jgi:hypothetical protein
MMRSYIKKLKSRRMRLTGNVAIREKRNEYIILVRKPEGTRPLIRDQDVGWWIILKWISEI